jgi:hypothetical protein
VEKTREEYLHWFSLLKPDHCALNLYPIADNLPGSTLSLFLITGDCPALDALVFGQDVKDDIRLSGNPVCRLAALEGKRERYPGHNFVAILLRDVSCANLGQLFFNSRDGSNDRNVGCVILDLVC